MASCWRSQAVLKVFQRCVCRHQTPVRTLSFLAVRQGRVAETLLERAQVTCLVRVPENRQKITFSKTPRKFIACHKEDGVSPDFRVIYENNMNRYHFWGQLCVNVLAVPIYGLSIRMIVLNWQLQDFSIESGLVLASAYIAVYSILVFGVNGLCRRSIRRMYANEDATEFAAVVQDWKMMRKTVHFDLSAAKRVPPDSIWGSFFGNVIIKRKRYLISATDFVVPKFYNLLMGYDLQRSIDLDIIKDIDIKDVLPRRKPSKGAKG
ncbi:uncharacterized protein [Littorina saxatilis]|uniref:Uncharacterized protein n=1 Tax=Littorina saxatilis TaxID=31220 RepID=A0AAN9C0T1_9CAEN